MTNKNVKNIRYVALGDSYTIGQGTTEGKSWPSLLTQHLQQQGIKIELISNPSVTGWTTQQLIAMELPAYDSSSPTFATLLIGVNDLVQGVSAEAFQENLILILNRIQAKLPDRSKLLLVTIPDFSVTPTGKNFISGPEPALELKQFNLIIQKEGQKRDLPVVDIYPISQQMKGNPDLVAPDGLHPSAKEYALWEKLIYPVALELIKK